MTNKTEDYLPPDVAASEIQRVERRVRLSRRWHMISMLALGLFIIAFFAVIGWVPREVNLRPAVIAPIIMYGVLKYIRKSNPPTSGKELNNLEMRLGNIFGLLMLTAVAIDLFLLKPYQGTVWAAFTGILPALPCFYGVWKVSRK